MFERYSEPARRVIFFARYEASQFGSTTIETEQFLLGLFRADQHLLQRFLTNSSFESIRKQIEDQAEIRPKTSTSIDLQLSAECKRILAYAAEESERLNHRHIGTEHLLLGILRETSSTAAKVLTGLGLELKTVREELLQTPMPPPEPVLHMFGGHRQYAPTPETPMPAAGVVPDIETAKRIAVAVWLPRFSTGPGNQMMARGAELKYGVWIVTGSYTSGNADVSLTAFIQKEDGKILRIHRDREEPQS